MVVDLLRAVAMGAYAGAVFREREFLHDGLARMGIHPRRFELIALHEAARGPGDVDKIVAAWLRSR